MTTVFSHTPTTVPFWMSRVVWAEATAATSATASTSENRRRVEGLNMVPVLLMHSATNTKLRNQESLRRSVSAAPKPRQTTPSTPTAGTELAVFGSDACGAAAA